MANESLTRRDFTKLSLAALGGAVAGSMLPGCADSPSSDGETVSEALSLLMEEPHVCRGLNTCKHHGASGQNDCAGQGTCSSAEAHGCHGHNECKGQGGCGQTAGLNSCKGQGKCGVPLKDSIWEKTRKKFEAAMTQADKPFGNPPPKS